MARGYALCFAVLLAVLGIGSCLQCYECNTGHAGCGDKVEDKYLKACTLEDDYIRTHRLADIFPILGHTGKNNYCVAFTGPDGITARTCMTADSMTPVTQACKDSKFKKCFVCDKDKCNGSSAITASLPVALLALVATYLFHKQ